MSPEQERREVGRRRLLQVLGASGGTALLGTKWAKPIVDMVVIPVHAQATGTTPFPPAPILALSCGQAEPPSGSFVLPGAPVSVVVTARQLDPETMADIGPFPDIPIVGTWFCDGVQVSSSNAGVTDVTGQLTVLLAANPCSSGETLSFQASSSGVVTDDDDCFWPTQVTTTTPPPMTTTPPPMTTTPPPMTTTPPPMTTTPPPEEPL